MAVDAHELDAVDTYLESEIYGCELRTLSDVIDEHGVERIDLLKIDAEKSELDILLGLRDEHWPRVRQMVLEVHTRPLLDAILQLLERHEFDATYDRTLVVEHGSEFVYMLYAVHRAERAATGPCAVQTLQAPAPGELRRFLKERLPDYMVPTAFVTMDAFPLTLSRKVDRLALPAPAWERPETETEFEPPREGTEVFMAALWAEVLGVARVGANDNFFELGERRFRRSVSPSGPVWPDSRSFRSLSSSIRPCGSWPRRSSGAGQTPGSQRRPGSASLLIQPGRRPRPMTGTQPWRPPPGTR